MSGGRFDYFYFKVGDELEKIVGTLIEMIQEMEKDPSRFDPEATKVLKEFYRRLTLVSRDAGVLYQLLHDVEWVASWDYGPQAITQELEKIKKRSDWWNEFNPNKNPQGVG